MEHPAPVPTALGHQKPTRRSSTGRAASLFERVPRHHVIEGFCETLHRPRDQRGRRYRPESDRTEIRLLYRAEGSADHPSSLRAKERAGGQVSVRPFMVGTVRQDGRLRVAPALAQVADFLLHDLLAAVIDARVFTPSRSKSSRKHYCRGQVRLQSAGTRLQTTGERSACRFAIDVEHELRLRL